MSATSHACAGNRSLHDPSDPPNGNGFTFVGDFFGTASNNIASGNSGDGFNFSLGTIFGTVSGNTANYNAGNGFAADFVGFGGQMLNNTASSNQGFGFLFNGVDPGGLVDGNVASFSGFDSTGQVVNLVDGFSFSGDQAHCREGYEDADGLLAHVENIGAVLEEALKISDITRFEFHGPAGELAKVRERLGHLNAEYFTLEYGFRRNAR